MVVVDTAPRHACHCGVRRIAISAARDAMCLKKHLRPPARCAWNELKNCFCEINCRNGVELLHQLTDGLEWIRDDVADPHG